MIGVTVNMDEMTILFKVHHAEKIGITHKVKGDGLQTDAIFQKGYRYQIFKCNDHVSKHIYLKGCCHLMLKWWTILILHMESNFNAQ